MTATLLTTSWDDGSRHDLRVAKLLEEFGLTGTFYASTGPTGRRTIDDAGLRHLARFHELGNHGQSHIPFTQLSCERLSEELRWGKRELQEFGEVPNLVAPPRGRMNRRVLRCLETLGYVARTAPIVGRQSRSQTILEPSFMFYPHGAVAVARNSARRFALPAAALLMVWGGGGGFAARVRRLLRRAVETSHAVHFWGHALDVERLDLWNELAQILAYARSLPITPATNAELLTWKQRS